MNNLLTKIKRHIGGFSLKLARPMLKRLVITMIHDHKADALEALSANIDISKKLSEKEEAKLWSDIYDSLTPVAELIIDRL